MIIRLSPPLSMAADELYLKISTLYQCLRLIRPRQILADAQKSGLCHGLPPRERPQQGALICILQVSTHRQPAG